MSCTLSCTSNNYSSNCKLNIFKFIWILFDAISPNMWCIFEVWSDEWKICSFKTVSVYIIFKFFYNITHLMHLIGTYMCMPIVGPTVGCQSRAELLETKFHNNTRNYSFIYVYLCMHACMYVCMYGFVYDWNIWIVIRCIQVSSSWWNQTCTKTIELSSGRIMLKAKSLLIVQI